MLLKSNFNLKILFCEVVAVLITASTGEAVSCYVCTATTLPYLCFPMECSSGASCFTQAWIENGQRYYQRGCFAPNEFGNCETLSKYFCSNTNAFHCCNGENCNSEDPLLNWAPKIPTNLVSYVTDSSVELSWDPVCIGDYRYDVEYAKLLGGTTAGQDHTTVAAYTNAIEVGSLESGTSYLFWVRTYHGGVFSEAQAVEASTLATPSTTGAKCWETDRYFEAENYLKTCPNSGDWCFTQAEYFANTSERLHSRGCMSESDCQKYVASNDKACKPGEIGTVCHFCCKGQYCNTVEWTYSGLTCENIPVEERLQCGRSDMPIAACLQHGCCYMPSNDTTAWCHHGKYPAAPAIAQAQFLSAWVIVLIVLFILFLIIIVAIIVYYCRKRQREKQKGSYDVYAIPKSRRERGHNISTVSRESYDNMVID